VVTKLFSTDQWITWLGATLTAAVAGTFILITFTYATFESRDSHSSEIKHIEKRMDDSQISIDKRLDRMEEKIDRLLQRK
jgi:hypothetical protein